MIHAVGRGLLSSSVHVAQVELGVRARLDNEAGPDQLVVVLLVAGANPLQVTRQVTLYRETALTLNKVRLQTGPAVLPACASYFPAVLHRSCFASLTNSSRQYTGFAYSSGRYLLRQPCLQHVKASLGDKMEECGVDRYPITYDDFAACTHMVVTLPLMMVNACICTMCV